MAQEPVPLKLFQIEEPDGPPDAEDGLGMAVGIALSRAHGASLAAAIGGNAELLVPPEPDGLDGASSEAALTTLLGELRSRAEKLLARPVTHALIRLDGIDLADSVVLRAAAKADLALLGIRRGGTAMEAAIEAEDLAAVLSR
jgi:hypothetical protein